MACKDFCETIFILYVHAVIGLPAFFDCSKLTNHYCLCHLKKGYGKLSVHLLLEH